MKTRDDLASSPQREIRALAAEQRVAPADDFDALLGDFWPDDESVDEFIAAVRRARRDGA